MTVFDRFFMTRLVRPQKVMTPWRLRNTPTANCRHVELNFDHYSAEF
jgi:hypothetical protein